MRLWAFDCTFTLVPVSKYFSKLFSCLDSKIHCQDALLIYHLRCCSSRRSAGPRPMQSPPRRNPKSSSKSRSRKSNSLREIHTRKLDPIRVHDQTYQPSFQRQIHAFTQSMACGAKRNLSVLWHTRPKCNLQRPVFHSHTYQPCALLQRHLEIE